MQTSVKDVLNRRGRSRFYSGHCCIVSEKRTKVFVLMLMAAILAFFAYDCQAHWVDLKLHHYLSANK